MGPLQPLREQGGGDGALGSKARRPRALRVLPPGQGGHVGIPAALSPSAGFSFLSSARRVSPPPHARPAGDLFLPRSLPRTPRPSPSPNPQRALFTHLSPLSPGLRPRGRRSPNLGHRGPLGAHPRAPRSPTRPSDRTQPCGLPRLVPPSPQLQPARRSPALPRSLPLGPGSDTTESWSRSGLNVRLSSGGGPSSASPGSALPAAGPPRPLPRLLPVPPVSPSWASPSSPRAAGRSAPLSPGPPPAPAHSLLAPSGARAPAAAPPAP